LPNQFHPTQSLSFEWSVGCGIGSIFLPIPSKPGGIYKKSTKLDCPPVRDSPEAANNESDCGRLTTDLRARIAGQSASRQPWFGLHFGFENNMVKALILFNNSSIFEQLQVHTFSKRQLWLAPVNLAVSFTPFPDIQLISYEIRSSKPLSYKGKFAQIL
jgi:hypothetical protein